MKKVAIIPRSIILLALSISFIYSKDILLESIALDPKSNGIIVTIDMDSTIDQDNATAWQANSGWFYITLYKAKGDTMYLLKDELPKGVLDYQAIQGEESFQIGLRLRQNIEHYEFSFVKKNTLITSLHYSTEYFSTLDSVKDLDRSEKRKGLPDGLRKWLYLTGTGIVMAGSVKDSNISSNTQTQAGIAVIVTTFIIDKIWKIL
ncbi:MAG: hypothetical protein QF780_00495 [Candidatus Marinimicrobia bacterium]|jgi:hypothetical protein|nr:hypothetical protein [Candidatus Neomarinimicrobiota bacterium]|tara:strand:- start:157 stop:771 length:615 start_codon:yes stop_codon:yes gene_type:complete